jgi:hypothetical protein
MATLADEARRIIKAGEPAGSDRDNYLYWAAIGYIDHLNDGCDEPDELLEMLAQSDALEDLDAAGYSYEVRTGKNFNLDFDDWFNERKGDFLARAAEAYVPQVAA